LKIGRLRETDVLAYIDGARLPTIEIEIPAGQPLLPVASFRFSAPVMRAILERYRPAVRNSRFTLLVPNEDAAR
jgi:hypothetical protein